MIIRRGLGYIFAVVILSSFGVSNALAVSGSGTTTYMTVWSDSNTVTGFANLVFDSSTLRLGILTASPLSTLSVAGAPPQSSTSTLLLLDTNSITGGNGSGTYIGANPSTFNGDFINFEVASSSKFRVASSGALTVPNLTATGLGYGAMIASGTTQVTTVAPGASGNILTSNGSAWTSAAPTGAGNMIAQFTFGENVGAGEAVYVSGGSTVSGITELFYNSSLYTDPNLLLYYRFEGNSNDAKGTNNGNDTAVTYGSLYGQFGQGAAFNAVSSKIVSTNSLGISGDSAFTYSAWVYQLNRSGDQFVLATGNFSIGLGGLGMVIGNDGSFKLGLGGTPGNVSSPAGTVGIGKWHMLTVTKTPGNINAGTVNLYYDGASVSATADGSSTPNVVNNNFVVGAFIANGPSYGNYFNGYVDDAAVFTRALSGTEVSNLYSNSVANGVAGRVYAANAIHHAYSDGFVGFSAATTSAGTTASVIVGGLAQNITTNLTAGKQYYLGNSSGTVSATQGSIVRKVGVAVSTTTLLITNIW